MYIIFIHKNKIIDCGYLIF